MTKYDVAIVRSGSIILTNAKIKHDQYMDNKQQCKTYNKRNIFHLMLIKS